MIRLTCCLGGVPVGAHEAASLWPLCDSVRCAPETTAALRAALLWRCHFFSHFTARVLRDSSGILSKPPANQTPLLVVEEADAVHGHGHAVAPRAGQHRLVLHRAARLDDVLDAELGGDVHVVREGEERV